MDELEKSRCSKTRLYYLSNKNVFRAEVASFCDIADCSATNYHFWRENRECIFTHDQIIFGDRFLGSSYKISWAHMKHTQFLDVSSFRSTSKDWMKWSAAGFCFC